MKLHLSLIALVLVVAACRPAGAADKNDTKPLPIGGRWLLTAVGDGVTSVVRVTIKDGTLRIPGYADLYWKNIRPVPGSATRYSAVKVSPGVFWGIREDAVEFYLDDDGVLHHDDSKLWVQLASKITLRRP